MSMTELNRAIPVQKWAVTLEAVHDEQAAIEAWHALVRAQGWSPVGEPEVIQSASIVVGRLVRYPGLTVSHDVRDAILVPPGDGTA